MKIFKSINPKNLLSLFGGILLLLANTVGHTNTVTYIYTDPQGTPLAEADANGNITATFDYTPYGSLATNNSPAPNGPGYTGHVNDPDTGFVYMQARYYDPGTGQFLSIDPLPPVAGNTSNFSRYAYAGNNPIRNIDPNGKQVFGSAEQAVSDNSEAQANSGIMLMCQCDPIYTNTSGTGAVQSVSTPFEFGIASGVSDLASNGLSFFAKMGLSASADFSSAGGSSVLRFSQITASPYFHSEGNFAGKSIADVAGQLRTGALSAAQVPVQTVSLGGNPLIVNTRSALSLMQSGTPQSGWSLIDMTGHAGTEAQISLRLSNNGLSKDGTDVLRITGSGSNTSTLIPEQ